MGVFLWLWDIVEAKANSHQRAHYPDIVKETSLSAAAAFRTAIGSTGEAIAEKEASRKKRVLRKVR